MCKFRMTLVDVVDSADNADRLSINLYWFSEYFLYNASQTTSDWSIYTSITKIKCITSYKNRWAMVSKIGNWLIGLDQGCPTQIQAGPYWKLILSRRSNTKWKINQDKFHILFLAIPKWLLFTFNCNFFMDRSFWFVSLGIGIHQILVGLVLK